MRNKHQDDWAKLKARATSLGITLPQNLKKLGLVAAHEWLSTAFMSKNREKLKGKPFR
jgi:hypothetical protein